jgi:PhnB protein
VSSQAAAKNAEPETQEIPMTEAQTSRVVPYLTAADAKKAIRFYVEAFGAREVNRQDTPDGKSVIHAELALHGGTLMVSDDFPDMNGGKPRTAKALGGTPVTISLIVANADAVWAQATRAGAKVVMPLADQFWGDRFGMLEDPEGIRWSVSMPVRKASDNELRAGAEKHFGKT